MTDKNAFIAGLLASMPDSRSRDCLTNALRPWGGQNVYIAVIDHQTERRRRIAESMLRAGASKREAAEAICARFGVTIRTAYRDCEKVMSYVE